MSCVLTQAAISNGFLLKIFLFGDLNVFWSSGSSHYCLVCLCVSLLFPMAICLTALCLMVQVLAEVLGAEAALGRIQFVSGTHAIATALYSVLRPGDELLAVAGRCGHLAVLHLMSSSVSGSLSTTPCTSSMMPTGTNMLAITICHAVHVLCCAVLCCAVLCCAVCVKWSLVLHRLRLIDCYMQRVPRFRSASVSPLQRLAG